MKTIVGSLPDCPNGTVTLSFPRPAKVISTGLPAPGTVEIRLDSGGNVPAGKIGRASCRERVLTDV